MWSPLLTPNFFAPSKAALKEASSCSLLPRSHSVARPQLHQPSAVLKNTHCSRAVPVPPGPAIPPPQQISHAGAPGRGGAPPPSCQGSPSKQLACGFHIWALAGLMRREGKKAKSWDPKCWLLAFGHAEGVIGSHWPHQ